MIKCFICLKQFHERTDYEKHIEVAANCPVFKDKPVGTCGTYSNVFRGFDENRTKIPQFLYPIIGAAESGKSYYLHTITKNLVERSDRALNTQLGALKLNFGTLSGYDLKEIQQLRLIKAKDVLGGTVKTALENNIPIVLSCTYRMNTLARRMADICFFDLAGTLFHNDESFMKDDKRISGARGLIVFIDPFRDVGLNKKLLPDIQQAEIDITNEASQLIKKLANLLPTGFTPKVKIPIAFCLSMFDLLEHNVPNDIPDLYVYTNELSTDGGFNESKVNKSSKAIEKFLRKNSDIDLDFIENHFLNYKWFTLSTIGHNNIADKPGLIESRGIYTPLFWLFKNNGIVS